MTDLKTPQARQAGADAPSPLVGVPYVFYRDEDSISLLELMRLFYAQRRLIAVVIGIALLVSLIPPFLMTPVYRAEVLLAPVALDKNEGMSSLLNQFGDLATLVERYVGSSQDQTVESIATLRSRALATAFIQQHQLKPRLFPDRWHAERQQWRNAAHAPSDLDAYEIFDRRVRTVGVDRRSGLVTLAMEWSDPALAAGWANALVREVNERRRAEAVREAAQSIRYLEQELGKTSSVEIRQSIYRLIEAQTKGMALAQARAEYAFKVIDPAVAPQRPIRPRPLLMIAVGLVIGTVLAIVAVLIRRAWQRQGPRLDPLA